jgi:DNA-directed RNA polymerase specialized sigma24 family protein
MITPATPYAEEQSVLRARQAGELSGEESFRVLYDLYGRSVLGWLLVRAPHDQADDLFQEIWSTFYLRWRNWEFRDEVSCDDAKPVLSFLFRTAAFAWKGHRRKQRPVESLDGLEAPPSELDQKVELGQCLDLASEICSPEEVEVIVARLSGMSGIEVAQALGITEAIADHRYRGAIARLRRIKGRGSAGERGRRLQKKETTS